MTTDDNNNDIQHTDNHKVSAADGAPSGAAVISDNDAAASAAIAKDSIMKDQSDDDDDLYTKEPKEGSHPPDQEAKAAADTGGAKSNSKTNDPTNDADNAKDSDAAMADAASTATATQGYPPGTAADKLAEIIAAKKQAEIANATNNMANALAAAHGTPPSNSAHYNNINGAIAAAKATNPTSKDAPSCASFSSNTTQVQNNLSPQTSATGQMQSIPEGEELKDMQVIGISLCVSNKQLDLHDCIRYFLGIITAKDVLNYKGDPKSAIPRLELIKRMEDKAEANRLYNDFFCFEDDIPRSRAGALQSARRCGAFYVRGTQTYREMKLALWDNLGGKTTMNKFGWYLNPYEGIEPNQKIIAFICGKNTSHGYPRGYADRIKQALKEKDPEFSFRLSVVPYSDRKSDGTRVSVFGVQIGRSQAKALEKAMRSVGSNFNGLYVKYKTEKKDYAAYDRALENILHVPSTYTGIPLIGLGDLGASHLLTDLKQHSGLSFQYPVDVEATHLATKLGKYMVLCPVLHLEQVKQAILELFSNQIDKYSDPSFPDGPAIQPPRPTQPSKTSPPPSITQDPFGDLSVLADQSTAQSTVRTIVTFKSKRQHALRNLPAPGPVRKDLFNDIPKEISTPYRSYAEAAALPPDEQSLVSQLTDLAEENKSLQQTLHSREETIQTLEKQIEEHKQETEKAVTEATEATKRELDATKQQVETLATSLKQAQEEHASTMKKVQEEHKAQVDRLVQTHEHEVKMWKETRQRDLEEAAKQRKLDQDRAARQRQLDLEENAKRLADLEARVMGTQVSASKRPRNSTPNRDVSMNKGSTSEDEEHMDYDDTDNANEVPQPPILPRLDTTDEVQATSEEFQQLSMESTPENMERHVA